MVSVTSENIHVSMGIHNSWVAISRSWFFSWNKTWGRFLLMAATLICVVVTLLFTSHLVPVCIKRFISILNDEAVLHSDACWWCKFFMFYVVSLFFNRFWRGSKCSLFCWRSGWGYTSSLPFDALFFPQLGRVLTGVAVNFGCASVATLIFDYNGIVWTELLSFKIENTQVIQLFCQFKNTSKDVHFIAINNRWMATARYWFEITVTKLDWAPLFWFDIKLPHVVELLIIIILTTENVHIAFVLTCWKTRSNYWTVSIGPFLTSKLIRVDWSSFLFKSNNLWWSRSIDKPSKSYKRAIIQYNTCVIISTDVFNFCLITVRS